MLCDCGDGREEESPTYHLIVRRGVSLLKILLLLLLLLLLLWLVWICQLLRGVSLRGQLLVLLWLLLLRVAIARPLIRLPRRVVARVVTRDIVVDVSGRGIGIRRWVRGGSTKLSLLCLRERLRVVLERIILIWGLVLLVWICLHGVNFIGYFF